MSKVLGALKLLQKNKAFWKGVLTKHFLGFIPLFKESLGQCLVVTPMNPKRQVVKTLMDILALFPKSFENHFKSYHKM